MSIAFDFEWHDVPGRAAADVTATMARLEIRIDQQLVTQAFDKRGRSVRDGIITPLSPIAEWIAANWWSLLEECETPARSREDFETRHWLRAAERGFALPDLRFASEGTTTFCQWQARTTRFATVDFFSQGFARIATADLRGVLWNFVEAVAARLNDRQVVDSPVVELWSDVRSTAADALPFCQLAGRLGLDPYEIDPALKEQIAALERELSHEIRDEFAAAVSAADLSDGVQWITRGLAALQRHRQSAATTQVSRVHGGPANGAPWSRGYRLAREFRKAVGQSDELRFDLDSVSSTEPLLAPKDDVPAGLNAVIRRHGSEPLVYSAPKRPESLRFLRARALFAFCESATAQEALLTDAHTAWQQQSRAFAAELLAPEAYLRAHIHRDVLGLDEVSELAAELGVSTMVIERQVANHKIARIELSDAG